MIVDYTLPPPHSLPDTTNLVGETPMAIILPAISKGQNATGCSVRSVSSSPSTAQGVYPINQGGIKARATSPKTKASFYQQ
jgi:hypothetical protein